MNGKEMFLGAVALGIAYELSNWAFSRQTKEQIKQRARESHGGRLLSEISHVNGVPMECAHWNHSRKNPYYDDPDNGIYVTIYEHLNMHREYEGRNGLTVEQNQRAIASLEERISVWEQTQNLDEYYRITAGVPVAV